MPAGKKEIQPKPKKQKDKRTQSIPKGKAIRGAKRTRKRPFHVIGIGASAGGLSAIESFFKAMPDEIPDMAFVVVSHLDPSHSSILPELLQKHTSLKVMPVKDGVEVKPHRVYVIPPDNDLQLENGKLILTKFQQLPGPRAPINHFFRSLAEQQQEMAIGIILSGMGSDGTIGIQAIKGELGMVMVQDPESAKYDGMPQNAISTGLADYILPPEEMPGHLIEYVDRMRKGEPVSAEKMPSDALKKIHAILRTRTSHDFSHYKESTVRRRIGRRMNVHGMEHIWNYVRYLQEDDQEAKTLIKELLIGVTRFFRDGEAFDALKEKGLPKIMENKPKGYTFRAWVAGCASGEEAYSVAIVLREYIAKHQLDIHLQIFATDLDDDAIKRARAGIYAGDISVDVDPERLNEFFKKENGGYRVSPSIRETIVFAPQSVIKDPPFTKVDLICCRNLLIYLDTSVQKKLLPLFHYSLNPEGILFLGTSETIGQFTDLFSTLDSHWKIFQQNPGTHAQLPGDFLMRFQSHPPERGTPIQKPKDLSSLAERTLLDRHTPPAIIIDSKGNIRYIHGRITKYLEHPQGPVSSYNAFEMAREGLKIHLISTIRKMGTDSGRSREKVQIGQDGESIDVRVTISPMPEKEAPGLYVVLFEELSEEKEREREQKAKAVSKGDAASRIQELERALQATQEKLRSTVEELESANEELRSANEEYQSTNEELQSANEELNSSKEELQSLNEELETVNSELQGKVKQVERGYNEMNRMLNSLAIPSIFLDHKLCIRRFSSNAERIVELLETDIGRPLKQLSSKVLGVALEEEARKVIDTMRHVEKEVRTEEGQWYLMRILPYQGEEDRRSGVVLTFVDIEELKGVRQRLESVEEAWRYAEGIVETVREPLVVLDLDLKVISANESFYKSFHVSEKEVEGRSVFELADGHWDIPELRKLLEEVLPKRQSFDDFQVEHTFPKIGKRKMMLNARRIHELGLAKERILLAIEDVTEKG